MWVKTYFNNPRLIFIPQDWFFFFETDFRVLELIFLDEKWSVFISNVLFNTRNITLSIPNDFILTHFYCVYQNWFFATQSCISFPFSVFHNRNWLFRTQIKNVVFEMSCHKNRYTRQAKKDPYVCRPHYLQCGAWYIYRLSIESFSYHTKLRTVESTNW